MEKTKIEITYFDNKFTLELSPMDTVKFINHVDYDETEVKYLRDKYDDYLIKQIKNNKTFYECYRDIQLQNWKDEEYNDDNYPFEKYLYEEIFWIYQITSVILNHRLHLPYSHKGHNLELLYEDFEEDVKIDFGDFMDHHPEYVL